MGSTSVTYIIVPNAFRAAQQPLPTCKKRERMLVKLRECMSHVHSSTGNIHCFTDLPVSAHYHLFSSKHDASGPLQPDRRDQRSQALYCSNGFTKRSQQGPLPVQYGLLAAVKVVELLLGHRVVDVDSRDNQPACL